jgi:hypothetical protein
MRVCRKQLRRCVDASAAQASYLIAGTAPALSALQCRVLTSACGTLHYTQITEALAKIQAGEKFDAVSRAHRC